jgi:hypothetical protein
MGRGMTRHPVPPSAQLGRPAPQCRSPAPCSRPLADSARCAAGVMVVHRALRWSAGGMPHRWRYRPKQTARPRAWPGRGLLPGAASRHHAPVPWQPPESGVACCGVGGGLPLAGKQCDGPGTHAGAQLRLPRCAALAVAASPVPLTSPLASPGYCHDPPELLDAHGLLPQSSLRPQPNVLRRTVRAYSAVACIRRGCFA